jgi:hypothetical protein
VSNEAEYKVERPDWWPAGPWMTEPDKVNWKTEAGLPGMIIRTKSGHLCGYVAVTKEHPLFEVGYGDGEWPESPEGRIEVHGGLTYSAKCAGNICHVPEPGEPDDVWWFGFDCAHSGDWSPSSFAPYLRHQRMPGEGPCFDAYRDIAYVRGEVESLARQLADMRRSSHDRGKP